MDKQISHSAFTDDHCTFRWLKTSWMAGREVSVLSSLDQCSLDCYGHCPGGAYHLWRDCVYTVHIYSISYRGAYSQISVLIMRLFCTAEVLLVHMMHSPSVFKITIHMYCTPHLPCRGRGGCPQLRHVPQSPHSPVGTRSSIGTTHKLLGKLGHLHSDTTIHPHNFKGKEVQYTMNLRYQLNQTYM